MRGWRFGQIADHLVRPAVSAPFLVTFNNVSTKPVTQSTLTIKVVARNPTNSPANTVRSCRSMRRGVSTSNLRRRNNEYVTTFVATFEDGEVARLTTYQHGKTLDIGRGVRLAHAAYESRMKKAPPSIVEAHY